MSILSNETIEHCIDGVVVSQRVIKLFGLPIYSRTMETSNYNYVGQFDSNNFINDKNQDEEKIPLYTETHIGFANEETNKETTEGSASE